MTRVLFVPDGKSVIMLVSSLPAEKLAAKVNAGIWEPPPPFGSLTSNMCEGDASPVPHTDHVLYALQLDQLVIITSISRQKLTQNRSAWDRNWKALYEKYSSLYPNNDYEEDGILELSPRQMQVLSGLAEGLTTNQIALRLEVTPRTVRMHVMALKDRFEAKTLAELVGRVIGLGLLQEI